MAVFVHCSVSSNLSYVTFPFIRPQSSAMKRSLRSVDSTGDTVTFASQLSTSFFSALQEACLTFGSLFEEHYAKPEILNLLLNWVQKQVSAYVEILIPQVSPSPSLYFASVVLICVLLDNLHACCCHNLTCMVLIHPQQPPYRCTPASTISRTTC